MGLAPFERIIFNFPLLPMKVHKPRASNNDVQIANRAMLVEFLRGAASFLRKDGVLLIANKDCYPYSWWRLEALPEWAGGELMCLGALPWKYTEYPSLYGGPCNVNRDASVKPTDAVIFLYVHADSPSYRRAINAAASSWRYCCSPGCVQQDPFDFRCEVCLVSTRTAADFAAHKAGKIHRKRVALEDCWEAALRASQGRSLMEVTCNLHGPAETEEVQEAVQLSWASRLFWWAFAYCPCGAKSYGGYTIAKKRDSS